MNFKTLISRILFNFISVGLAVLFFNVCIFAQETNKGKFEILSTMDLPNIMLNRPGSSYMKVNYKTQEGLKDFIEIPGNEYNKYSKDKVQSVIAEYEEFSWVVG